MDQKVKEQIMATNRNRHIVPGSVLAITATADTEPRSSSDVEHDIETQESEEKEPSSALVFVESEADGGESVEDYGSEDLDTNTTGLDLGDEQVEETVMRLVKQGITTEEEVVVYPQQIEHLHLTRVFLGPPTSFSNIIPGVLSSKVYTALSSLSTKIACNVGLVVADIPYGVSAHDWDRHPWSTEKTLRLVKWADSFAENLNGAPRYNLVIFCSWA
jgi:hypothetical protein